MPPILNQKVEQLRQQYLAILPQRASQIEELWNRLRYLNWSTQGVQSMHTLVHRLAASGASFGAPKVSDCARVLDTYLQEHLELNKPLGGVGREIIDQMVENLCTTLNENSSLTVAARLQTQQSAGIGKLIFVVDDDDALSALVATYLRANGFDVEQFNNPKDCVIQLRQQSPDAILTDTGFQDKGAQGLDAIEYIRIEQGNHVPILVLSARTDIHARLRALRAGCAHYLTKPVDFSLLIQTLATAINIVTTSRRVMIVDDDKTLADYYGEILRHAGMEVVCVSKPLQSLQHAIKFNPDLVILDMHMQEINGIELAILLREEERFLALPIVFVTADTSKNLRNSVESLGVNGLLTKPISIELLVNTCEQAIKGTIALKNRIARVTRHATHHQQITRSYFFGAIDSALQQQYANDELTALYYIGSDAIAQLLEDYGQNGLATLHEQLCEAMSQIVGNGEQWADISNLVICVLASRRSQTQHLQRAAQIVAHLRAFVYDILNNKIIISTHIGISYSSNKPESANSLLRHAEQAYESACAANESAWAANNSHQMKPENFVSETQKNIHADINIEYELPTENLRMSYQPMIGLEEHKFEHYEALIRWKTDTDELIPAHKFIHKIKTSSLSLELDRWALQAAIAAMMADSNARENADLFIHLTEEALHQKSFFAFIANVLYSSRLRGDRRVIFMLQEAWVAANFELTSAIIKTLRDIHCGTCLSHAGETPESEKIINHYLFDYIKLMPQLTANILKNDLETSALKSIISTATATKTKIIAAQVENSKSLSVLWQLGVRLFQGHFIQPPDDYFHTKNDVDFACPENSWIGQLID